MPQPRVNLAINVIQISALIVFTVIAIAYRINHMEGSKGITLDPNGTPISKVIATATTKDDKGVETTGPVKDKDGNFVFEKNADGTDKDYTLTYAPDHADRQREQTQRIRRILSSFILMRLR